MPRKEFSKEVEQSFEEVEILLNGMLNDRSVPRNIKRKAQVGLEELAKDDETHGIIASNVMYLVSDLSQDPNIPFSTRTTVYRIISILETIKD